MQRNSRLDPLAIVAYLTLAGVTAIGLWQMDRILTRTASLKHTPPGLKRWRWSKIATGWRGKCTTASATG